MTGSEIAPAPTRSLLNRVEDFVQVNRGSGRYGLAAVGPNSRAPYAHLLEHLTAYQVLTAETTCGPLIVRACDLLFQSAEKRRSV